EPAAVGDAAGVLARAAPARTVPLPESATRTAAVADGGLAHGAPGGASRAAPQTGDPPHAAPQLRDPSARSGERHPRDPGLARPSLPAHDHPLRHGLPPARRHGAEPPRRAADGRLVLVRVGPSWRAPCAPAAVPPGPRPVGSTWRRSFVLTAERCASSRRSRA